MRRLAVRAAGSVGLTGSVTMLPPLLLVREPESFLRTRCHAPPNWTSSGTNEYVRRKSSRRRRQSCSVNQATS
jgi:hypothetical protein